MKRKLLALAAMMICVAMMLSSCALFTSDMKFKKVVQKDFEPETNPTPTGVTKLDIKGELQDDYHYYSDDLIIFIDTNESDGLKTTTVYNVATNETIWTGADSESKSGGKNVEITYSVELESMHIGEETVELAYITKETATVGDGDVDLEYDITVITEAKDEIVTLEDVDEDEIDNSWQKADLLCIGDKVYRISEDGKASFAFDWNDLREVPNSLEKAGDYYVYYEDREVYIYDANLNMTAAYSAPLYSPEFGSDGMDEFSIDGWCNMSLLSNGNVLVQYVVRQDDYAKKYTFLLEGQKYNLYSVLVQAKNGKTKDLSLDYLIQITAPGYIVSDLGLSEKIENLGIGFAIEDQRINMDENAVKMLSINNKGKVVGVVQDPVPNAYLGEGFEAVAKNRWEVYTVDGRSFLLNEKGDVIGEISGSTGQNNSVLLAGKKVYDWSLNLKVDLADEDAERIEIMQNSVVFHTDKDEVKLFVKGEMKTLISQNQADSGKYAFAKLSDGVYMITDKSGTDPQYKIYNEEGTLLSTITDKVYAPMVTVVASNGALLLVAENTDGSGVVYYRVG
ncbi:MAG: hypothetical protein E7659_04740 [Ruminococcaceae bacterium]|nr:hypothetical protein [Oscillospiraceae bacterium]